MSALKSYFTEIFEVFQSTRKGMALTWKHAWNARKQRTVHQIQETGYFKQSEGIVTLEYPNVQIPTPVNGRYQLHNEMDDCIVCDKCVKVCPVDCIDIEPIKATGLVGHASDGSPIRLYAAKFDIDMSKCCFCGLCTTVCPTECLTMTSEYDFSVYEVKEHNFSFANLTPEEADEKRKLYEQFVAEKEAMKAVASQQSLVASPESVVSSQSSVVSGKDAGIPKSEGPTSNDQSLPSKPKPAFKPSFKKVASQESSVASSESVVSSQSSVVSGQDAASPESEGQTSNDQSFPSKPKPAFKPSFKKAASPASNAQSPTSNTPPPNTELP
jgi:NADH-quinone oxidoreductase subunit I